MAEPSFRQDPPRSQPNYGRSIVSVALVLFLLGFFGMVVLQARQLVAMLKEEINLIVEINDIATLEEKTALQTHLESSAFLKPESLRYISKEEGIQLLRDDFGEDFLEAGLPNPLHDVYVFNVKAQFMHPDSMTSIRTGLMKNWYSVSDVYYQQGLIETLAKNLRRIGWVSLGISLFFIFVAFVLIHNTIRLALYSNRFIIKTQELVGASWEFISKPFLRRSVWNGVFSGLLGIALLNVLLWVAQQEIPELKELHDWPSILFLFGILIAIGVLITWSSTYYVVNKYLKMRVDDLY
ncbi:MAG: hypothetical protein IPL49_06230 [Saprospirales bacterium]|nr:hypothetical protein [Saprospirales bacterium]